MNGAAGLAISSVLVQQGVVVGTVGCETEEISCSKLGVIPGECCVTTRKLGAYITHHTIPTLFENGAEHLDLRCVFCTQRRRCWVQTKSRIQN